MGTTSLIRLYYTRLFVLLRQQHFIWFVVLGLQQTASAQSTVTGTIKGPKDSIIPYATVIAKTFSGDSILAYTIGDENGKYKILLDKAEKIKIIFSALSFEPLTIFLTINKNSIDTSIVLKPLIFELQEVVIKTDLPIETKGDTIIYNVKKFLTGREEVVEDLIKRLPGLSVDKEGVIKFQNQEIEKVMVEGNDFFERGYRVLTKNMPAQPIAKVELLQHYSENKHLKGIENSDKIALNLVLSDSARRKWFGNLAAGYGYGEMPRYDAGMNLMNFGKKAQYYLLCNFNNIGKDATGDLSQMIQPNWSDNPVHFGDAQSSGKLASIYPDLPPALSPIRTNLNNDKLGSLNAIYKLSDKIKLKLLGFAQVSAQDFYNNSFDSLYNITPSFINKTASTLHNLTKTVFGRLDILYDINSKTSLEYSLKGNTGKETLNNNMVFNSSHFTENLHNSNKSIDQKLVITNKINANSVLAFSARFGLNQTPQTYSVQNFPYHSLFTSTPGADNLIQPGKTNLSSFDASTVYLNKKKSGNLVEIIIGTQLEKNTIQSDFQLKKQDSAILIPSAYSNHFQYKTANYFGGSRFTYKFKKMDITVGMLGHAVWNQLNLYINQDKKENQYLYLVPSSAFTWKINDRNQIKANYTYQTTNIKATDLLNGFVNTGFRSFEKGIDKFDPLNSSKTYFQYTLGNWTDKSFVTASIAYIKNFDYFSTDIKITPEYIQSQKIVIANQNKQLYHLSVDRYVNKISSNFNFLVSGSFVKYRNILNSSEYREINSHSVNYGISIRSMFSGPFNYNAGTVWTFQSISVSGIKNTFTNNNSFADIGMSLKKINLLLAVENFYFGNAAKATNNYYFADIKCQYIAKANRLILKAALTNLFNTKVFREYSITDLSISNREFRLQPLSVVISGELRF